MDFIEIISISIGLGVGLSIFVYYQLKVKKEVLRVKNNAELDYISNTARLPFDVLNKFIDKSVRLEITEDVVKEIDNLLRDGLSAGFDSAKSFNENQIIQNIHHCLDLIDKSNKTQITNQKKESEKHKNVRMRLTEKDIRQVEHFKEMTHCNNNADAIVLALDIVNTLGDIVVNGGEIFVEDKNGTPFRVTIPGINDE